MTSISQRPNPWLRINQPNPHARLRLFCLPYAGGAASVFRTWHQHLPAAIEVCAVQLPGREDRIRERPFGNVGALVEALTPNLLPYLDKPFAIFGHSMGTLIAYELAQQLLQKYQRVPTHLFVSSRRAPMLPNTDKSLHDLNDDETFLREMQRRYSNIPDLLFTQPELRELFVPLLRADMRLVESYRWAERAPLPCPIIAFGGEEDERISPAEYLAWQKLTQRDFELHRFAGGHFYLNEQTESLLATIARYLAPVGD